MTSSDMSSLGLLRSILDALGVSTGEFISGTVRRGARSEGAAPEEALHSIPVITWVVAGRWKEVCDSFEPGDADEWIESDVKGKNVFSLRVVGDSMEPEFSEGDVVIVSPHVESRPNDYVVVKNPEGEATFKQLKKYGSRWVLHPLNPKYADQEVKRGEFMVIGRVVKKEKRY